MKTLIMLSLLFVFKIHAQSDLPVLLTFQAPNGSYPSASNVFLEAFVISPVTNCILMHEQFSNLNVVNGKVSLVVGTGIRGSADNGLTLEQVFSNAVPISNLSCFDSQLNVVATSQTYNPLALDTRSIRVSTTLSGDNIVADFRVRNSPFSLTSYNSVALGGRGVGEFITQNLSSSLNQTNLNNLLFDSSRYNNLLNLAINGASAGSVTSVAGKTGAVSLVSTDISGLGNSASRNVGVLAGTVAAGDDSRIVGALQTSDYLLDVSPATCTSTQTASWNAGAGVWECLNISFPASAVTSVAGKAGTVSLVSSDITDLGNSATRSVGVLAGTVAAGDDTRIVGALQASDYLLDVSPATCSSTQTASWNTLLDSWECSNIAFPASAVTSVAGKTGVVSLVPSDISGLGNSATRSVGVLSGTVAAGDDGRIVGALQTSDYLLDVSPATCSSTQTANWNTLLDSWQCTNIAFPASPVTSVAGKTGVVSLVPADIVGLGTSATLNVGSSPNNLVQLDAGSKILASLIPNQYLTTSSTFSGDISGTSSTIVVGRLQGVNVSATAPVNGNLLIYNGTSWVPTSFASLAASSTPGVPRFIRKTSVQAFSTTTLANVTDLSFSVVAGSLYKFKFYVSYTSAAATTGLGLGLIFPVSTVSSAQVMIPAAGDGTASFFNGVINSSGDNVLSTATPVLSTQHLATIEGTILPTANGTVDLTARSEINASAVTILQNSFVEVTIIP